MIDAIYVGVMTIITAVAFMAFIIAPALRLVVGCPPEKKTLSGSGTGIYEDDGKPFPTFRGWGDAVLNAYIVMAILLFIIVVAIGVVWVIGEVVLTLT